MFGICHWSYMLLSDNLWSCEEGFLEVITFQESKQSLVLASGKVVTVMFAPFP